MQFAIAGGVVLLAIDVLVMRDAGDRTSTRLGFSQGLPPPTAAARPVAGPTAHPQ
jgi:hypothetical protein